MYEYAPQFLKKKEKMLTFGCFALGAVLFLTSAFPGVPAPWVFQVLAVVAFVPAVSVFSLCLFRRYVYTVSPREDGGADFIITEYCGKRMQLVCRISLSSVEEVAEWSNERRKAYAGRQYFAYSGVLFDEKQYAVLAEEGGVPFLIRICADDTLLRLLSGSENT